MLAGMMRSKLIPGWTSILPMRRCCCATLERKISLPSLWTRNERSGSQLLIGKVLGFMTASKSFVFRFDDVEVREREFSLTKAGKVLSIEPKAFRVLLFLLHNPQKLITKDELLNAVWGDTAVTEGSLSRCIWLLRSVLGDDIRSPRYIETVPTVGYRFIAAVEERVELQRERNCTRRPGRERTSRNGGSGPKRRRRFRGGGSG